MSEYDGDIDIHEDPRPNSNDDQQRQDILDGAPKDLKRYLNSKINLGFGSFTLLQTRNFYNTVSTSDKRLLVGKWLEACETRNDGWLFQRKKIFNFLQWPFKCPGCKVKKLSGNFAPNEFTLEVPGDGVSEPVLNSKAYCNGCPALRTQA
ncbi:hypothetical protein TRIATDRAFT_306711 [Trichoderma atroviride IMI 206040]|uniref:Uncharacterized protein n=1 Tax=Hypocrea atroviridis (strain ATCC 20476 / IMI 206040) TaxID=452589 RepID=G9NR08_HYPAI|nr:uncharacterized protein TRIATDRAFT_306711 [Trichoderma atroviride IMI 206040]EHK46978.1 hypothetical protein TRIATDRAFT_306711 [Trichoderma atroviride IMI 206040]